MNEIDGSILNDVLTMITGSPDEHEAFKKDAIIFINSAFSTLNQIGVGPEEGFRITDDTATWSEYCTDPVLLDMVKEYIYLKTRISLDPPSNSFLMSNINEQIKELIFRMNVQSERG